MRRPNFFNAWSAGVWPIPIFIRLKEGASPLDLEKRFAAFTAQHFGKEIEAAKANGWTRSEVPFRFGLQNIKDVYLDAGVYQGKGLTETLILSGFALLVLIMACVNFTNLSIGTAAFRAKEIGVRKIVGAERRQLFSQFLSDSLMTVAAAASAGILAAALFLPTFNRLMDKDYHPADLFSVPGGLSLAALLAAAGFLAGGYPALVMAGFRPVEILRGRLKAGPKKIFTNALVVFQFTISVILIISTIVIQRQMKTLLTKDLGYRRDGLIAVSTQENRVEPALQLLSLFKNLAAGNPEITGITACGAPFGLSPAPRQDTPDIDFHWDVVDPAFMRTIGADVVRGEDFRRDGSLDRSSVLVNESFVKAFGGGVPLGLTVGQVVEKSRPGYDIPDNVKPLVIRGVVKDFQFAPLEFGIFPAAFYTNPVSAYSRILIRVSTHSLRSTLDFIERKWKEIRPEKPIRYYLQDEALKQLLYNEIRWNQVVSFCSILTILMACMGIFGLTQITLSARTRDVGIRKILGAGSFRVAFEIYRDVFRILAAANILAWPAAFFILGSALNAFPYRISLGWGDFLAGGALTAGIAGISIFVLVAKAAKAQPVAALKQN